MDLYRYFHPHHNPRLRHVPLRLQELSELEQAAIELKKALQRAEIRAASASIGGIREEHFAELVLAIDYIVESLHTLGKAHPGDSLEIVSQLLEERKDTPGWENWSRLLHQRLHFLESDHARATTASPPNPDELGSNGPEMLPTGTDKIGPAK